VSRGAHERVRVLARVRAREQGGVSVVALGVLVLALAHTMGAARLGSALVGRARAESAADAAALAAADALALGQGSGAAAEAAGVVATRNDARLVSCECTGDAAQVVVEVDVPGLSLVAGPARARARAEVSRECALLRCRPAD
jgi:secretion/DNA translocation related TadE-like protein